MATERTFELPPPGLGLKTVICDCPGEDSAKSLAGIAAFNCVLLTNVVGREVPFHKITELDTKLEPVPRSVNAAPPTTTVAGETEDN